jgi:hypothetical protein
MSKSVFDVAREAMTVLEFFQVPYSSGVEYQRIHSEVLFTIRNAANNEQRQGTGNSNNNYKFLMMLADALEQSNKPGVYEDHFGVVESLKRLGLGT